MAKKENKEKKEKPLDRLTAKELREHALTLGEIEGVHGMNKEELIAAIKEIKGISDDSAKAAKTVNVRELKEQINTLRQSKVDAVAAEASRSKINILRKRINRLRKKTRKTA
jgi:hypothetical protein